MHFLWETKIRDTEMRRYAGGLLKESPEPPRTFLKLYLAEAGWWDAASGGGLPRASIRVLQTRQKRLSRFCNTRHPSRHAGAQEKAGTGHERRIPSIIICSEKFWGVWGTLSRVPQRFPALPQRFPALPQRFPSPPRTPPRFNAEKQAQEAVFFRRL